MGGLPGIHAHISNINMNDDDLETESSPLFRAMRAAKYCQAVVSNRKHAPFVNLNLCNLVVNPCWCVHFASGKGRRTNVAMLVPTSYDRGRKRRTNYQKHAYIPLCTDRSNQNRVRYCLA